VNIRTRPGPKYRQIFDNLGEAIRSGKYAPGQRLPSEAQLVKAFGTSRITVNRALRELQLGGLIDRRAGSGSFVRPRTAAGDTLGLVIPELGQTEIFEPICRGMALAEQAQQHVLLWGKSIPDSQLTEAHVPEICHQLISQNVSGVFFAPLELTPRKDAINQLIVKTFADANIPVVLLDRDLVPYPQRSELDLVGIDNRRAGHIITAHLLSAGAKKVMFVGRPHSAPTVDARIAGFRDALLEANIVFEPAMVVRLDPANAAEVQAAMKRFRPDAIVCANDITAAHLMRTLQELRIAVPDKIRMAGIDDVKYASLLSVPLTTIHQPCAEMGKIAIAVMANRLRNPGLPAQDVRLNFRLVIRQSSGARPD
jgi:GntR family transcriptional regulator of arabinose operon